MQNNTVSVSLETYNTLKQRIMNLYYRPGEILLIQQLVSDLNVSRTPVKEALIRLAADGFLDNEQGKKFKVREVSQKTIAEVFETRMALEGMVAESLAKSITKEQLRVLKKVIDDTAKASRQDDALRVLELDDAFHGLLVQAHGNETLAGVLRQLNEHIQQIRVMTHSSHHIGDVADEHLTVYQALADGDGPKARGMMHDHLHQVCDDMLTMLGRQRGPVYAGALLQGQLMYSGG